MYPVKLAITGKIKLTITTPAGTVLGTISINAIYGAFHIKNSILSTMEMGLESTPSVAPKCQFSLNISIHNRLIKPIISPHSTDHFTSYLSGVYDFISSLLSPAALSKIMKKLIIAKSTPEILRNISFEYAPVKSTNSMNAHIQRPISSRLSIYQN